MQPPTSNPFLYLFEKKCSAPLSFDRQSEVQTEDLTVLMVHSNSINKGLCENIRMGKGLNLLFHFFKKIARPPPFRKIMQSSPPLFPNYVLSILFSVLTILA